MSSLIETGRKILLSGSRPTGHQHIGNYVGALSQWLKLQDEIECFLVIADWHALTNSYRDTSAIRENIRQQVLDWLSIGLDPNKATIFVQSAVKEHAELHLLLSMFTPLGMMERTTTWKDLVKEQGNEEMRTYGFLGYPCLQSADILMYQAHIVPVGKDQVEHIEKCQDIAQKVNFLYGSEDDPVFRIPEWKLSQAPVLLGNDGRKMSKSYDNCIYISESAEEVEKKVSVMVTDPARVRRKDPGEPENCSVWSYHKVFTGAEHHDWITEGCRSAGIGCRECKALLAKEINTHFEPARQRRTELERDPNHWRDVLQEGNARARERACRTMDHVREKLKLYTGE